MRHTPPSRFLVLGSALTLLSLTGCSGTGSDLARTFGLVRDAPDEFRVSTRAPLSMPPDFNLPLPRPGAPRPQEQTARDAAEAALAPETALATDNTGDLSAGQQALVTAAGPPAPGNIRQEVDASAALDSSGPSFTDKLMFWRAPATPGIAVDPQKEQQRLRANAALGQSVQQGDTPIIQPRSKTFFDWLF